MAQDLHSWKEEGRYRVTAREITPVVEVRKDRRLLDSARQDQVVDGEVARVLVERGHQPAACDDPVVSHLDVLSSEPVGDGGASRIGFRNDEPFDAEIAPDIMTEVRDRAVVPCGKAHPSHECDCRRDDCKGGGLSAADQRYHGTERRDRRGWQPMVVRSRSRRTRWRRARRRQAGAESRSVREISRLWRVGSTRLAKLNGTSCRS